MRIRIDYGPPSQAKVDVLVVGMFRKPEKIFAATREMDKVASGMLSQVIQDGEISGKKLEASLVHVPKGMTARKLLLVGLGEKKEFNADVVRQVAGMALRQLRKRGCQKIGFLLPALGADALEEEPVARSVTEGAILATYNPDAYKTEKEPGHVAEIVLCAAQTAAKRSVADVVRFATVSAECANYVRTLVNDPGNKMTPTVFAAEARKIARKYGLKIDVLDRQRMEKLGMNTLLAVAKGSDEPPKLVVLRYSPSGAKKAEKKAAGGKHGPRILGLVGKGITFDTGGICLKPAENMEEMKTDMAGAASVLGTMRAAAELGLPQEIIGVMPCTENLPSGKATRPGDVVKSLSGKTVEIINTDAEGRLILSDALHYARTLGATHLVDAATLTGACVVALGHVASGMFSNNDELANLLLSAAGSAGEKFWRMPLYNEYKEQIKSAIADVKNVGGRPAGVCTAAMFLKEFVANLSWVHLDIAGTAWARKGTAYAAEGPTGIPVRTLIQLVKDFSKPY